MQGVFQLKENRDEMRKLFKGSKIELVLFKPQYTEDESEDNDCTEDESKIDSEDSHSSQEEKDEEGSENE